MSGFIRDGNDKLYLVGSEYGAPSNTAAHLSPGVEIESLPIHEPSSLHCEYCDCHVETAPTCSQCGAPLHNPADDMPRYVIRAGHRRREFVLGIPHGENPFRKT